SVPVREVDLRRGGVRGVDLSRAAPARVPPRCACRLSQGACMSSSVPCVDLSIVVPAFNEQHRLPPTLARLSAYLQDQPLRWEIVVVDDGSRDATCAVVEAAMADI